MQLEPVFSPTPSASFALRDLRLATDGTATLTLVATTNEDAGICSMLLGADCHSHLVSCLYILDEFVAGALFDAHRERAVTWTPHESGFLALHVFDVASASLLRRATLSYVPGQKLQRIEWAGDRIVLWMGDADEAWALSTLDLSTGRNAEANEDEKALPPQVVGASGLGLHWDEARRVKVATDSALRLNHGRLSSDGTWALARGVDGSWTAVHLGAGEGDAKIKLDSCLAACFAEASSSDVFTLRRDTDAPATMYLEHATLVRGVESVTRLRRLALPWLAALTLPADAHPIQLAVRVAKATTGTTPLAVWVHVESGGAHSVHGAADEALTSVTPLLLHADLGELPSGSVALSARGIAIERNGVLLAGGPADHANADASIDDVASHVDVSAAGAHCSPAWRPVHWGGTVAHALMRPAPSSVTVRHPASHPRFSFGASVREHLTFGPQLVVQLLRPCNGWRTGSLDAPRLVCLGWDRTADGAGWQRGEARFFRNGRFRIQSLARRPDLQSRVPHDPALVMTDAMAQLASRLLEGYHHAQPVLLEGDAAGGKTAAVAFCANRTNSPLVRFNMTPNTTIADFVGQLGLSGDDAFTFCLGPLAEAVKDGLWLLLDEANLATDAVLRVVEDVLSRGYLRLGAGGVAGQPGSSGGQLTIPVHPNFRIFATQNSADDAKYGTTRHLLSASLLSHFAPVVAPAMEPEQMRFIVVSKLLECDPAAAAAAPAAKSARGSAGAEVVGDVAAWFDVREWAHGCADALMRILAATHDAAKAERLRHTATLRDVLQAAHLVRIPIEDVRRRLAVVDGLKAIYTQRLRRQRSIARIARLIDRHESDLLPLGGGHLAESASGDGAEGRMPAGGVAGDAQVGQSVLAPLPEHRKLHGLLDVAHATGKPTLICGPDLAGKAAAALAWSSARGMVCETQVLTPDCTAEDLFGKLVPSSSGSGSGSSGDSAHGSPGGSDSATSSAGGGSSSGSPTHEGVSDDDAASSRRNAPPPFRWQPGAVTRAMERGCMLLLRGIDVPQPAVLESLNAVLEVDATTAGGGGQQRTVLANGRTVVVHPGFYVVCTSRASQHDLTPALASRFLSVAWGGEDGTPHKLTGAAGFDALVDGYTNKLSGSGGGNAVREAVRTALAAPLRLTPQTSGGASPPARYPVGETAFVLRTVAHWWAFTTAPPPFGRGLQSAHAADGVGDAATAIASLLTARSSTETDQTAACDGSPTLPVRLQDVHPGMSDDAVYALTGFSIAAQAARLDDTRRRALDVVLTCIKCAVPLVLEGPAGVGKTKLVDVAYRLLAADGAHTTPRPDSVPTVQFSKSSTLQDVVGQWRPSGDTCTWVDGPLYLAMRGGYPLLCDEMNLAPSDVISFLVPLLETPSFFECPFGAGRVPVAPGFVIIAAQNPPHYAGRSVLPRAFVRRALCISVRPYLEAEVLEILIQRVLAAHGPGSVPPTLRPRLTVLMHALGYTDDALADAHSDGVTLRHVLKLLGRLLEPAAWAVFTADGPANGDGAVAWRDMVRLQAAIVFPERVPAHMRVARLEAALNVDGEDATFELGGGGQSAQVTLRLRAGHTLVADFSQLPASAQVLVCKLAFCAAAREPVLLSGPSCFKGHCVQLLGRSLALRVPHDQAVHTIFLSQLTEAGDLEGSIEPHSRQSFIAYLQPICMLLARATDDADADDGPACPTPSEDMRGFLAWHAARADSLSGNARSNARWCAALGRELAAFDGGAQGFPYCERGVMRSVRFGGVLFLRGFEMPDQAVVESLNALLEIDRSFRSGCDVSEHVSVHEELFIVASAHEQPVALPGSASAARTRRAVPEGLSPAVVSRLTLIHVEPPAFGEWETEYGPLVARRLAVPDAPRCASYMFVVLRVLSEHQPRAAHRLTLRTLLQWCDYTRLDREVRACRRGGFDEVMANLALGAQVLLLDQLEPTQRAAVVAALEPIEVGHTASCAGQHAEPDEEAGHYERTRWLRHGPHGTHLEYLGFRLSGTPDVVDFGRFEPSCSAVRNLSRVLIARDTGHAVNLIGPPGIGKSAVVEVAAGMLRRPFTRISCSRSLTVDDLFGSYRPTLDTPSGEVLFLFQKGPLAVAIENEGVVLLDELNLAPADVLGVLCALVSTAPDEPFETRNQRLCRRGTLLVAAMNDVSVGGGRQELPRRLDDLLTRVQLSPFSNEEMSAIAHGVCGRSFARAEDVAEPRLLDIALDLNRSVPSAVAGIDARFNLRTLQNVAAILDAIEWESLDDAAQYEYRYSNSTGNHGRANITVERPNRPQREYLQLATLMLVYSAGCSPCFTAAAEQVVARKFLALRRHRPTQSLRAAGTAATEHEDELLAQWRRRTVPVHVAHGAVRFGPVAGTDDLGGQVAWSLPRAERCDDYYGDATPAPQRGARHQRQLELLSLASGAGRMVMLEGPACSGKTSLVRELAWLRNTRLLTIAVNAETEVSDLIGGFAPTSAGPGEHALQALNAALDASMRAPGGEHIVHTMLSHALTASCSGGTSGAGGGSATSATSETVLIHSLAECVSKMAESASAQGSADNGAHTVLAERLSDLRVHLVAAGERGATRLPFRIYEGSVVVAMRNGYWLLLDNINAASPEVIERINSLGEADAAMHLFELGGGKVRPHPSFRCFATATTRRSSVFALSDAFRNRCIILQCEPLDAGLHARPSARAPSAKVARAEAYETLEQLARRCGCAPRLAHELVRLHEMALSQAASTPRKVCGYEVTVRNLHKAALMAGRGAPIESVLRQCYDTMAPTITQGLWDQLMTEARKAKPSLFDDGGAAPNAARLDDVDADDPSANRREEEEEPGDVQRDTDGDELKEGASGSITTGEKSDEPAQDDDGAAADGDELDGGGEEGAGDRPADSGDENATDCEDEGGGGDDTVQEKATQSADSTGTGGSSTGAAPPETATGGAGALRAGENGSLSVKERVQAMAESSVLEEVADGGDETATVSVEEEGGEHAHVSEGGDGTAGGGSANGTALGAPSVPSANADASPPSSTLLGQQEATRGDESSHADSKRPLSDALLGLVEALVTRLAQQVLTPAVESAPFCQLEAMAAEMRHQRMEHGARIRRLGLQVHAAATAAREMDDRGQHVASAIEHAMGHAAALTRLDSERAKAHTKAAFDAMLQVEATSASDARQRKELEAQITTAHTAYLQYSQTASGDFEDAIDSFETETAAALERVAKGTSVGVSLELSTLVQIRDVAVDIGMGRLGEVVANLRLKTHAEDDPDAMAAPGDLNMPGVDGLLPAARPVEQPRGEKRATDVTAKASPAGEVASSATGGRNEQMDTTEASSTEQHPMPSMEQQHASSRGEAGSASAVGRAWHELEAPSQLLEAAAALAASLVASRAEAKDEQAGEGAAACRAVQAVVCVDASVVGVEGGVLPPLLALLIEALQACNFELQLVVTGPREMTLPLLAKPADEWSPSSARLAMERVLYAVPAPFLPPWSTPPDVLLYVIPPTTEKGLALPLATSLPDACTALSTTRLGFVRIGVDGRTLECGQWSMDEAPAAANAAVQPPLPTRTHVSPTLEALLVALQPPRASLESSLASPWLLSWRGWSDFMMAPEAGVAAIQQLTRQLHRPTPAGSVDVVGEDLRARLADEASREVAGAVDGWISTGELRAEMAVRQEMRAGSGLLTECDALWGGLESAEGVQVLTDELVHALCAMPPNVYTQCSVGTHGKVLSIPALVKRYILGNSVTAIWKRQDRGGKRKLALCLALDLTPSHKLDAPLAGAVVGLVTALLRMQYVVHVLAFSNAGVWVVHVGGDAWESASKARLLALLAAAAAAGHKDANLSVGAHIEPPTSTLPPTGGCHVRQAIALGVQLLLSSPLAATSPKMLWLLTAGVAHSSPTAIAGVCAAAEAKRVEVVAISMGGACLRPLGCPRWLGVRGPSGLPSVLAAIFADERPRPPDTPRAADALAAVRSCAPASDTIKQVRRTGPGAAAAGLIATNAVIAASARSNVYLSGALDYTTVVPEEAPDMPPPPPQDDPLDDEIAAFLKKVRSSWAQVRTAPKLTWSRKGISGHDAALMARVLMSETREATPWNVRIVSLEKNALGDAGVATLAWALSMGALAHLTRLNLTANAIGHDGMVALSTALRAGALPKLEWLFLSGNRIDDVGVHALASALREGALPCVQQLWLDENQIGNEGVSALLCVGGAESALRELLFLSLDKNRIERSGVGSIVGAIVAGAVPKLKNCMLSDNPAGPRAQQQVADAMQKRGR